MNGMKNGLAKLGFDVAQLPYLLRTAFAAGVALLVAYLLGLEHPQWAAMTVWAASQPTRGQLLEKGLFRFLGTVVGVGAGVGLVALSHGNDWVLIAGLALWIGLCAAAGNLFSGFLTYGLMLSGYSASMVALLDTVNRGHVLELGLDRLLTISAGVATALVIGLIFTPAAQETVLGHRLQLLTARIMRSMANCIRFGPEKIVGELPGLLSEMALIEEALEPFGAGSLRSRQFVRSARAVLVAEVAALLWLRTGPAHVWPTNIADELDAAALALDVSAGIDAVDVPLRRIVAECGQSARISQTLMPLASALRAHIGGRGADDDDIRLSNPLVLHRDWIGARQAFIRATGAMLLAGALWVATGWRDGPFMLLGLSIMVSLFSTFENPAKILRFVVFGQAAGVVGALLCRFIVWPHASTEFELVLMVLPFILFGAFFAGHKRMAGFGFDYNMVMLLLLKPALPLTGSFAGGLETGFAVVIAPLIALITFRLVYPVDGRRRMNMLIAAMVAELKAIADNPHAVEQRTIWRARFYYRLLRLVRLQDKTGGQLPSAVNGGLAILGLADVLYDFHARQADLATSAAIKRATKLSLLRLKDIDRTPEKVALALARTAMRLDLANPRSGRPLMVLAKDIGSCGAFFKLAR